jgi:hypothetical protein
VHFNILEVLEICHDAIMIVDVQTLEVQSNNSQCTKLLCALGAGDPANGYPILQGHFKAHLDYIRSENLYGQEYYTYDASVTLEDGEQRPICGAVLTSNNFRNWCVWAIRSDTDDIVLSPQACQKVKAKDEEEIFDSPNELYVTANSGGAQGAPQDCDMPLDSAGANYAEIFGALLADMVAQAPQPSAGYNNMGADMPPQPQPQPQPQLQPVGYNMWVDMAPQPQPQPQPSDFNMWSMDQPGEVKTLKQRLRRPYRFCTKCWMVTRSTGGVHGALWVLRCIKVPGAHPRPSR